MSFYESVQINAEKKQQKIKTCEGLSLKAFNKVLCKCLIFYFLKIWVQQLCYNTYSLGHFFRLFQIMNTPEPTSPPHISIAALMKNTSVHLYKM